MDARKHTRQWGWVLLVVVGMALGILSIRPKTTAAVPSEMKGSTRFMKYALNRPNNPVIDAASTWRRRWTFSAGEPLQQASMARGVVYAAGDGKTSGRDHRVYAVDAKNGRLLWRTHLNNMSMTTPVVLGSRVFVGSGTQEFQGQNAARESDLGAQGIVRGTGASAIYALDAKNGRVIWKDATRGEDMPTFVATPRALYVANGNGRVYALQPETGAQLWSLQIGSYVSMASPTLGPHGTLYVSGAHPYRVYAINTHSHRLVWAQSLKGVFGGSDDSSPALWHGRLFLEGTEGGWQHPESYVLALSSRTGQILWRTALGTGKLPTDIEVSAPVVAHGRVYIGSPITKSEYALNPKTGRILWRFKAAGPVSESAAITPHTLYMGDGTGFLYALDPETGHERGGLYLGGALAADYPLVVGDTLYQPDENGTLLALPREQLLTSVERTEVPELPVPPGALGQHILEGEAAFFGQGLPGRTCATCHLEGGAITTYQHGQVVPALLGVASAFPQVRGHQVVTLDAQINRCLAASGSKPLSANDPRLAGLNLYLHWLASGWPMNLKGFPGPAGGKGGGC